MRARRDHHASVGQRGRTSARRRGGGGAAVVVAAATLSLTAGTVPASAAGGYTVTATIKVGARPSEVAVDPAARTVYVANSTAGTVSVIDAATNKGDRHHQSRHQRVRGGGGSLHAHRLRDQLRQ